MSGKPDSEKSASGKPASGKPASGNTASGKPASGKPASGNTASGKPASGKLASGKSASVNNTKNPASKQAAGDSHNQKNTTEQDREDGEPEKPKVENIPQNPTPTKQCDDKKSPGQVPIPPTKPIDTSAPPDIVKTPEPEVRKMSGGRRHSITLLEGQSDAPERSKGRRHSITLLEEQGAGHLSVRRRPSITLDVPSRGGSPTFPGETIQEESETSVHQSDSITSNNSDKMHVVRRPSLTLELPNTPLTEFENKHQMSIPFPTLSDKTPPSKRRNSIPRSSSISSIPEETESDQLKSATGKVIICQKPF